MKNFGMQGIQRQLIVTKTQQVIKMLVVRRRDFPIGGTTNISLILADMSGFTQTLTGMLYWDFLNSLKLLVLSPILFGR